MAQQAISGGGVFTRANIDALNSNFGELYGAVTAGAGNVIYCNPSATGVTQQDGSQARPFTSLVDAYSATRNGRGDVVVLVSNGAASGSARISSNFAWANNDTHLIGVSSGVNMSNRSRIAPPTTLAAFANFFTVSGSGCLFQNIQFYQGFATGTTSQIALAVSGAQNYFLGCHIAGMADDASAQSTGSRCIKVTAGENQFDNCTIGVDTIQRTVANASIEIASGAARTQFRNCYFPIWSSSADVLGLTIATGGADRHNDFINPRIRVFGTAITGFVKMAAVGGGPNSITVLDNPSAVGVTTWGYDATTDAQMKIVGPVTPSNGALVGLGVAPAA